MSNYPDFTLKKLDTDTKKDASKILDIWATEQTNLQETDYEAAQQALALPQIADFLSLILYVQGVPVAWCLAELAAQGATAVVHFEKARTDFRGSYQYINYAFAQSLPEHVVYINREQDLGDEGLRHAKMSYKPEGFVKKYRLDKGAL
nr:phosphatidylglycerol lysyltransferase domain-containing protein [Treponema sp. OMZ 838]